MTVDIFVVTDTKFDEPEIFTNSFNAYAFIIGSITEYGERYRFEKEEIEEAIQEMKQGYNEGNFDFFVCNLGERQMCCYRKSVRL